LEREQLAVLPPRVLELRPVAGDARHPRERAAHLRAPLAAAHHDPVPVVVELSDRTFLEPGEEGDGNAARLEPRNALVAAREVVRRPETRTDDRLARAPAVLAGKVPGAVARVALIDVVARS